MGARPSRWMEVVTLSYFPYEQPRTRSLGLRYPEAQLPSSIFSADMTTLRVRGFAFDIVKVSDNVSAITLNDACQPRLYDRKERVACHEKPMNSVYAGRMSR